MLNMFFRPDWLHGLSHFLKNSFLDNPLLSLYREVLQKLLLVRCYLVRVHFLCYDLASFFGYLLNDVLADIVLNTFHEAFFNYLLA